MRVMGLDISTYVGAVLLGESTESKLIHFPKTAGYERLQLIANSVRGVLEEWEPELIVLEGMAIGAKSSAIIVVECGCTVRTVLYSMGYSWWEIPATSLKLFCTGKGSAKKPDMARSVEQRWGFKSKSDDVIDAYAAAKVGELIVSEGGTTNMKGVTFHGNSSIQGQRRQRESRVVAST